MRREELLERLGALRRARVGGRRVPHKPLLVLWLLGRFAAGGSTAVAYAAAEEPVSRMINDFGPSVKSPGAARRRAAMPFVHLERELWELRDAAGNPIGPNVTESGAWLSRRGAHGRLQPAVELLLAEPGTLAAAGRLLIDRHFTPALREPICEAAGLELTVLEGAAHELVAGKAGEAGEAGKGRRAGFAEEVLAAYAYACAICGFDGALGRNPVGLDAAHVRWRSQDGPDEVSNALALCSLHHRLFDIGVLGLTAERRVRVSGLYVARSRAGRAIDELHEQPLARPRPGRPAPAAEHIAWHQVEVFKESAA